MGNSYNMSLFSKLIDPTPEVVISTFDKFNDNEKWWSWEPETIESIIPGDKESVKSKIGLVMSVASLLNQTYAHEAAYVHWTEPDIFAAMCVEFSGVTASINHWEKPSLSDILYGMHILKRVDKNIEVEELIYQFIAICLIEHSIIYMPGNIKVNKIIESKLKYNDGYSRSLIRKIEKELAEFNDEDSSIDTSPLNTVGIQVARIGSAMRLFNERVDLGNRQVEAMKL